MEIKIVAVHPSTVIVQQDNRQVELPLSAFLTPPKPGQHWILSLEHQPSEAEQLDQLNRYLAHD